MADPSSNADLGILLEIAKVWKAKWTLVKIVYIANRVINWLVVILTFTNAYAVSSSNSFCRGSTAALLVFSTLNMTINEWILLRRVDACYNHRGATITASWFAITSLLVVIISGMLIRDLHANLVFVPVVGCVPSQSITLWAEFISTPYLLFETTMFAAMVWRYMHSPGRDFDGGNRLFYAVFHNAAIYFLFILGIGFMTILVSNLGPPTMKATIGVLAISMGTSALSRSILSLRSLSSKIGDSTEVSGDISLPHIISLPSHSSGYGHRPAVVLEE